MRIVLSVLAVATYGVLGGAAPELPYCECMETWPGSADAAHWAVTFGKSWASEGWGIPSTAKGCQNLGVLGHDGGAGYQFCVPKATVACRGWFRWDKEGEVPMMACGLNEEETAKLTAMSDKEKAAGQAYAEAISKATIPEPCECVEHSASSTMQQFYCHNFSSAAATANREWKWDTCPHAPSNFDNVGSGTIKHGYAGTQLYNKDNYTVVEPTVSWCEVPSTTCLKDKGGYDECTSTPWMQLPNNAAAPSSKIMSNSFVEGAGGAVPNSIGVLQGNLLWPPVGGRYNFVPGLIPEEASYTAAGTWDATAMQTAYKNHIAKYDAFDYGSFLDCTGECEEKRLEAEKANAAAKAKIEEDCSANSECSAKSALMTCEGQAWTSKNACQIATAKSLAVGTSVVGIIVIPQISVPKVTGIVKSSELKDDGTVDFRVEFNYGDNSEFSLTPGGVDFPGNGVDAYWTATPIGGEPSHDITLIRGVMSTFNAPEGFTGCGTRGDESADMPEYSAAVSISSSAVAASMATMLAMFY